jgi:hypothetical protein
MWFSATFATEVSKTSIKVANMTAKAMNHGFTAGLPSADEVDDADTTAMKPGV